MEYIRIAILIKYHILISYQISTIILRDAMWFFIFFYKKVPPTLMTFSVLMSLTFIVVLTTLFHLVKLLPMHDQNKYACLSNWAFHGHFLCGQICPGIKSRLFVYCTSTNTLPFYAQQLHVEHKCRSKLRLTRNRFNTWNVSRRMRSCYGLSVVLSMDPPKMLETKNVRRKH